MAKKLVTQRAGIGATDAIDWKKIAKNGRTLVFNKDHVFLGKTSGGADFRILHPLTLERRLQGEQTNWTGNFAPGDGVLWTLEDIGPLVLFFDVPVRAAGAQIQQAGLEEDFEAFLTVIDVNGNSPAPFKRQGRSTDANNDSAIFLGVRSDQADIRRIELRTVSLAPPAGNSTDFAINRLDLRF